MLQHILAGVAAFVLMAGGPAQAEIKAKVVSTGKAFEIKKVLQEEGTTVLLFIQETSAMEQEFLADLEKTLPQNRGVALRVARIKGMDSPAAKQYEIAMTPTAIVYDRFARVLARTSQTEEIRAAVRKGTLMARIHWIDEDDPKAPEAYGYPAAMIKRGIPGIVKTMGLTKQAYQMFNTMSDLHFSDGFLKRREHELIAAYVSALNKCKF